MTFNLTQVTIQFTTDNDKFLLLLISVFWLVQKIIYRIGCELDYVVSDFVEAMRFYCKVMAICFNSVVWGVM